jgi:peptidyl-prolyl cis-trans isomerase D
VLQQLITRAALDVRARALGLGLSDEALAAAIRESPEFKDASGQFSPALFEQAMRDDGVNEKGYLANLRQSTLAGFMQSALSLNMSAPRAVTEAEAKYESETRGIDYYLLPTSAAGDIAAPSEDTLKAYYNDRKADYQAPEYRSMNILSLEPETLAKPGDVSDGDAQAFYDKQKDTRFGTPEKRKLQQIVFPDDAAANEAEAKIKAGASFDDIVKARNLADSDVDLGETSKSQMFDKAVADAAFALPAGGVSEIVKSQFGPVIVRVQSVTPGNVKPYSEVADEIKKIIATDSAVNDIQAVHDKIEDQKASGKSVVEAAKAVGLQAREIVGVSADGLDDKGQPVDLPEKQALLRSAFASDVGVDEAALPTKTRGFVWFEITKIEPARQRSFDETRAEVEKAWRAEEVDKALAAKAADAVKQLQGGASVASLAEAAGQPAKSAADIRRSTKEGLAETVVVAVFGVGPDGAGSAATPDGRVIFKVTSDKTPAVDFTDARVSKMAEGDAAAYRESLLSQYIVALRKELGVTVNESVLQAAIGG